MPFNEQRNWYHLLFGKGKMKSAQFCNDLTTREDGREKSSKIPRIEALWKASVELTLTEEQTAPGVTEAM